MSQENSNGKSRIPGSSETEELSPIFSKIGSVLCLHACVAGCILTGGYIIILHRGPSFLDDVPFIEFAYRHLVSTSIPRESYCRQLVSLLLRTLLFM